MVMKPKLCMWVDLNPYQLQRLSSNQKNSAEVLHLLSEFFGLNSEDSSEAILLDLYYYTLAFAWRNRFNAEKTSTFFSLVKLTHAHCVESPHHDMNSDYNFFKNLLLRHAIQRPPFSDRVFNVEEINLISEYVLTTYFRHYRLYKYSFTTRKELNFSSTLVSLPEPPTPAPKSGLTSRPSSSVANNQIPTTNDEQGLESNDTVAPGEPAVTETTGNVSVTTANAVANEDDHSVIKIEDTNDLEKSAPLEGSGPFTNVAPGDEIEDIEETKPVELESEAARELRRMVEATLHSQLETFRASMETKIKSQEDNLGEHIASIELRVDSKKGAGGGKKGKK